MMGFICQHALVSWTLFGEIISLYAGMYHFILSGTYLDVFGLIDLLCLDGYSISQEICTRFCFAVLCCDYTLTDFPISIRLTSLTLWQSNDCSSASKATLMNMDKYFMWIHYERLHNHNKAKHNKTVCIFLGIYCMWPRMNLWQPGVNLSKQMIKTPHSCYNDEHTEAVIKWPPFCIMT